MNVTTLLSLSATAIVCGASAFCEDIQAPDSIKGATIEFEYQMDNQIFSQQLTLKDDHAFLLKYAPDGASAQIVLNWLNAAETGTRVIEFYYLISGEKNMSEKTRDKILDGVFNEGQGVEFAPASITFTGKKGNTWKGTLSGTLMCDRWSHTYPKGVKLVSITITVPE